MVYVSIQPVSVLPQPNHHQKKKNTRLVSLSRRELYLHMEQGIMTNKTLLIERSQHLLC
mgnify:FL=1